MYSAKGAFGCGLQSSQVLASAKWLQNILFSCLLLSSQRHIAVETLKMSPVQLLNAVFSFFFLMFSCFQLTGYCAGVTGAGTSERVGGVQRNGVHPPSTAHNLSTLPSLAEESSNNIADPERSPAAVAAVPSISSADGDNSTQSCSQGGTPDTASPPMRDRDPAKRPKSMPGTPQGTPQLTALRLCDLSCHQLVQI
jgi:hypothetical protein